MNYWLLQLTAFAATFFYSSFFEWTLHRFFMHRPTLVHYPFKAHAQIHHQVFKSDSTYHIRPGIDKWLITFAWWNYPLLLGIHAPAVIAFELAGVHVALGMALGMSLYYFAYEYLHYTMHSPEGRLFENWAAFKFINRHHLIHHKYMHRNLNVVLPLADMVFGTLMLNPPHALTGSPMFSPEEADTFGAAPEVAKLIS